MQTNPSPATIAENDALGLTGICIPCGKLEQTSDVSWFNAQTSVWFEVSEMATVERVKPDGTVETEKNRRKRKQKKVSEAIETGQGFWYSHGGIKKGEGGFF